MLHQWDLIDFLTVAQKELGQQFDFYFTLRQYFDEIVVWEWQEDNLVYEDRIGQWHIVPECVREYVTKTSV